MIGRDHEWRYAEHLRRGQGVNVVTAPECLDQQFVLREVRQQTQLDLRVVGSQQDVSGFRDEGGANLAAEFGANWNVLEIRIRRG